MRSVRGDSHHYVSIAKNADIALRDLGRQVGRSLTFQHTDSGVEYMMSKSRVVMGDEDHEPEFTIEVYAD